MKRAQPDSYRVQLKKGTWHHQNQERSGELEVSAGYVEYLIQKRPVSRPMIHKEEDFYHPFIALFPLICQLYKRDVKPTFAELLKESQNLNLFRTQQEISELAYIAEHFIEGENITYWLQRVKDSSRLRKFEAFLRRYHQMIREKQLPVEDLLMGAEEELTNLTVLEKDDHVDSPAELANLGYEEVERRYLRFKEISEVNKASCLLTACQPGLIP